jgi:hypothetical protein
MRRGVLAAAVAIAILFTGCASKPARPDARSAGAGTAAGTPVDWIRLTQEDATRFGAQPITLEDTPSGLVKALPAPADGTLRHGVLKAGNDGEGRIAIALLQPPTPTREAKAVEWKLYVDRDLDGDLAEETPLVGPVQDLPGKAGADAPGKDAAVPAASFPMVDVALPGGGRYAFYFIALAGAKAAMVEARPGCALEATIEVLDRRMGVVVYDANVNGVFGECSTGPDRMGDAVWIDFNANGKRDEDEVRPLAPRFVHEKSVISFGLNAAERTVVAAQLKDVRFGSVVRQNAAPGETATLQLYSDEYGLMLPGSGEFPEGSYQALSYQLRRADGDGTQWSAAGQWLTGRAPRVEVRPERPSEVACGPALSANAWLRYGEGGGQGQQAMVVVVLQGAGGEFAVVGAQKGLAALGSYVITSTDGRKLGFGRLQPLPLFPGACGAVWSVPAGIEKDAQLAVEITPDLGPFKEGFRGTVQFRFGHSTPIVMIVTVVERGSQAERVGIKAGDAIVSYDGKSLDNPLVDLTRAMRDAVGKREVDLVVKRGEQRLVFAVQPGTIGVQTGLAMP